jgi:CheY-like chemotaxis protein
MKILIVDDVAMHRDLLEIFISKWPEHEFTSVGGGEEALAVLRESGHRFDVVFLDVNMPDLSGLDVLEQLRESPLHRSLQIVMCSTRNDMPTITKALGMGAKHYMFKPCTEKAVGQKLQQIAQAIGA